MQQKTKLCAWEIYLKNIRDIYSHAAFYFGVRFGLVFILTQAVPHPIFQLLFGVLFAFALTPLEFWWRNSLLEAIKDQTVSLKSWSVFYKKEVLCKKAMCLQGLYQAVFLWLWGVGYGLRMGQADVTSRVLGGLFAGLCWFIPFFLALMVQPIYVNLLLSPETAFAKQLLFSWRLMKGERQNLLRMWCAMIGWILLMALPNALLLASNHWVVLLLFYLAQWLACTIAAPYLALAGAFFSLRLLS